MERSAAAAQVEQRPPAAYIAEFIGTFVLVAAVTMAVCLFVNAQGTGSDWAVVGLVHFFVLFMLVMTIGSISGAHVNPAVTLALLALRKIRPNDAAVYIVLQLAGAVAGALLTKFLLIDQLADQQAVGTPQVNLSLLGSTFAGVIAEGVGTFFLVWAVVAVAVNPRAARDWAGLGNRPAAVLSDLMVAGSAGPAQLSAELGEIFDGAPLALMTGVPPRRRAALGVTHQRIVEKPFELEALIATVHSMIAAPGS